MRWSLNFMVPKCVSVRAPEQTMEVYKIFIFLPSWYCPLILICFFLNYFIHECEEVKRNSYKCISPFTLSYLICDLHLFLQTRRSWFVLETYLSKWKLHQLFIIPSYWLFNLSGCYNLCRYSLWVKEILLITHLWSDDIFHMANVNVLSTIYIFRSFDLDLICCH